VRPKYFQATLTPRGMAAALRVLGALLLLRGAGCLGFAALAFLLKWLKPCCRSG
jgi:hypothetical protein